MPRGRSGRIVVEIDPELKRELYKALVAEERTLKDWFVANAESFINSVTQRSLFDESGVQSQKRRK